MSEPNHLLDALLAEAGMSRQGLARRVNAAGDSQGLRLCYDHTSVGRWLSGQMPRRPADDLVCEVLSHQLGRTVSPVDAGFSSSHARSMSGGTLDGFIGSATAFWRADELHRIAPSRLPLVTGVAAIEPVWGWENPPYDVDVSRWGQTQVTPHDVQMLVDARARFEAMYRAVGGLSTHPRVAVVLSQHAAPLVHGTYGDRAGRELHRAVGGLTAIAGIAAYDIGMQAPAQRYFHQSLRFAKSSSDRAFGAYVLALMVNQSLALNDARNAVAFAESALRSAGRSVSPALAADLHVMQAKAYALLGDKSSAYASIRRAERAAQGIGQVEEPAETGYVEPGLIEAQVAEALTDLGDLVPADRYAQAAINPPAHTRGRVNRLATAATIALKRHEFDRAGAHAVSMIEIAQGLESHRLAERFRKIRLSMSECYSPHTQVAIEGLDRWLAVPQ